jgi:hypothetical protein
MATALYVVDKAFHKMLKSRKLEFVEALPGYGYRYLIKCLLCNVTRTRTHKSLIDPKSFNCKGCSRPHSVFTPSTYTAELRKRKPAIKVVGAYINTVTYTKHKCRVCDYEFMVRPYQLLNNPGSGCKRCALNNEAKAKVNRAKSLYVGRLHELNCTMLPITDYKSARTPIQHVCTACGFKKTIAPYLQVRLGRCTNCTNQKKRRSVTVHGKQFLLEGYEHFSLNILVKRYGVGGLDCATNGNVPIIRYRKTRRYHPDFYIKNKNLLVESKGLATFGMRPFPLSKLSGATLFYECCDKAKAAIASGFKYEFHLFEAGGRRIPLPDNWYNLKFREVKQMLRPYIVNKVDKKAA